MVKLPTLENTYTALKINSIKVEASDDVLLLRIIIEKKLTFKQHIESLCQKAQYV